MKKPNLSETPTEGKKLEQTFVHDAKRRAATEMSPHRTEADETPSEPSLSQDEDSQIRQLEDTGALSHIVGSQSVLSQELASCSQPPAPEPGNAIPSAMLLSSQPELDLAAAPPQVTETNGSAHATELLCLVDAAEAVAKKHATRGIRHGQGVDETRSEDSQGIASDDPQGLLYNLPPLITRKQLRQQASARRVQREQEVLEAQQLARRAASLAKEIVSSTQLSKQLLLSMALVRNNPRSPPSKWPSKGHVIKDGFFWASYPPLEALLKSHMEEFYDLSMKRCQSKAQQRFNTMLVGLVRERARELHWKFASTFTDKLLRDRIRCFYKTHIQNSKKRLRTMTKNPTKRANAKQLLVHYELISEHSGRTADEQGSEDQNYLCFVGSQENDGMEEDASCTMNPYPLTGPYPLEQRRGKHVKATLAAQGPVDAEVQKVAQIMSLGFANLSQDEHVKMAATEL